MENGNGNSRVNPTLLSKLNGRRVLEVIQTLGPSSRAEVTRHSGISAPTVSKVVDMLLEEGLLEEGDFSSNGLGRPSRQLRLATRSARVLGLVLDAGRCTVVSAGLDGTFEEKKVVRFRTPATYRALLEAVVRNATPMISNNGVRTLGLGISMPGLMDHRSGEGILSPNLHQTDGRSPREDLAARLKIPVVSAQEANALCLAERLFGAAQGLDDFAVLDVSTGLGLGVFSGGRLIEGGRGLAGELGHAVIEPDGNPCGCGNRGCLETIATDSALARAVSRRLGREVAIEEIIQDGLSKDAELEAVMEGLATAIGIVVNIFNPTALFVHGRLLEAREGIFDRLMERVKTRGLKPSLADCRIIRSRGSKRQGAVAAIVRHLLDSMAPRLERPVGVSE